MAANPKMATTADAICAAFPNFAYHGVGGIFAAISLLRRHTHRLAMRIGRILIDALFDFAAEMADQALHRPRRRVAEGANRVTLNLPRDFEQLIDFALLRTSFDHAREYPPHPTGALAAGRALAAGLVLVEIGDARDRIHDIGGLVPHDHSGGAEA